MNKHEIWLTFGVAMALGCGKSSKPPSSALPPPTKVFEQTLPAQEGHERPRAVTYTIKLPDGAKPEQLAMGNTAFTIPTAKCGDVHLEVNFTTTKLLDALMPRLRGSSEEVVKELKAADRLERWTLTVPTFARIDAAVHVGDGSLTCWAQVDCRGAFDVEKIVFPYLSSLCGSLALK